MVFTRRFLVLLALGALPLLLSGVFPLLQPLTLLYNLVLLALAVLDRRRCPTPEMAVAVARQVETPLAVERPTPVVLTIRNTAPHALTFTVRDTPPPEFVCVVEPLWPLSLAVGETITLTYTLTAPRRGDATFGDHFLRVVGPLGLVARTGQVAASQSVAIYPDLHAVAEVELGLRRAQRARQGVRRARLPGQGREFATLRDYTPDDAFRVVDWKATARRGKLTARTFEAERTQDVVLLIDEGRLMRQEVGAAQKLDHVVRAALMLAHVVAGADDRVGVLTFADQVTHWLVPRRGRAQTTAILENIYALRAEAVESDYRLAFQHLATHWRKRSLVVLFTDIADPETSAMLLTEIGLLAVSHLVVCVVVRDPQLTVRAEQATTTPHAVYERAVAEEVRAQRRDALALLEKRGVLVVDAEPASLSAALVARYLAVKHGALL